MVRATGKALARRVGRDRRRKVKGRDCAAQAALRRLGTRRGVLAHEAGRPA